MNFQRPIIAVLLVLMCACSTYKPAPSPIEQHQSNKPIPEQWQVSGKLGLRSPKQNGSLTFFWRQQQQKYHINISAPLGQFSAFIYGDNSLITIEQSNKPNISLENNEQQLQEQLGLQLPLNSLKFWIRGLSDPSQQIDAIDINPNNTLNTLEQNQWQLHYTRYQKVGDWLLPEKIIAKKDNTRLTLLLREWTL